MRKNDLIYASKDAVIQRYRVCMITISQFVPMALLQKGALSHRAVGGINSGK